MNRVRTTLVAAFFILVSSAALSETINEVKSSASNWMQVTIEGIVTYIEADECYIEDPGRSGGIWVLGPTDGIELGDPVIAFGTFSVISGEPVVLDASIYLHGRPSPINPFGMTNRDVGGASKWSPMWIWDFRSQRLPDGHSWIWQLGWAPACGANNTGLVVKTWGTVRSIYHSVVNGAKWFYIDDGSGPVSDFGDTGVLVYGDAEIEQGDYVAVTGISSTEPSNDDPSRLIRVIRTRGAKDVQWLAHLLPEIPQYPFTDEFDSPTLDKRWIVTLGGGEISLVERPGWLTITPPMQSGYNPPRPVRLIQFAGGDWDLDMKIEGEWSTDSRVANQFFYALVSNNSDQWPTWPCQGAGAKFHRTSTAVSVAGKDAGSVPPWTAYFRLRSRAGSLYGSVSADGITYQPQPEARTYGGYIFVLTAYVDFNGSVVPPPSFRVHIDYIRFTLVGGGGAQ